MKSAVPLFSSGYWIRVCAVLIVSIWHARAQLHGQDVYQRRYMGTGIPGKNGGWRPMVNNAGISGLTAYSFASNKPPAAHKIISSPGMMDIFGSGIISTSTRPLVTRDVNKQTSIAQSYKTSPFSQSTINMKAPINSYLNPFSFTSPGLLNNYKLSPGYQFDSSVYNVVRQPYVTHRPVYTKAPQQQLLLGKRYKQNPMQLYHQHAASQYQQTLQTYQNAIKKPLDSYYRPGDNYANSNQNQQSKKPSVNPQDSLAKQTQNKPQAGQSVAAVTYKPPLGSHYQQFGGPEEAFAPIPSSILGSFSSFGHASVLAREPSQSNKNTLTHHQSTKAPPSSTLTYDFSPSTIHSEVSSPQGPTPTSSANQNLHIKIKDNYYKAPVSSSTRKYEDSFLATKKNYTNDFKRPFIKDNFIPSPIDPLSKFQNNLEAKQPSAYSYTYSTNLPSQRPSVTSFFDDLLTPSTSIPYESHSIKAIPESLSVQLPPPYIPFSSFPGQNIKIESGKHKDKYQVFATVNHNGAAPAKYNLFEDIKYVPPRGQQYVDIKYNKNKYPTKEKSPFYHSYEVTENWEPSGESATQPTLHSWQNPSQTFKQYNNVVGPPKSQSNVPVYFPVSTKTPELNLFNDYSTVYSIVTDKNQNKVQLENSVSSSAIPQTESSYISDESSYVTDTVSAEESDKVPSSTVVYTETTTQQPIYNSRRKPSKYRPTQETTTTSYESNDFSTRFEVNREQGQETENDLQVNALPTIPPNKHFKRPISSSTPSPIDEERNKKLRSKNRRRRPGKQNSSTEETPQKEITTTDIPPRTYRYRTTTLPAEIEETTRLPRPKVRFPPPKPRPTRPSSQPELTSSAQPTVIPTHPITMRPKLSSRVRPSTPPSLDLDDLFETTTIRDTKASETNHQQSSIMKIAKDNHSYRVPSTKFSSGFGYNEAPDYSHKQDEKDTPTSDTAINTSQERYSVPRIKNESSKENNYQHNFDFLLYHDVESHTSQEVPVSTTEQSFFDEQFITTTHRNPVREYNADRGTIRNEQPKSSIQVQTSTEADITTTNINQEDKTERPKTKASKYDTNRPRFSVKDYKNRINQYASTTTTEKPHVSTEVNNRLRFPNRSRFPIFKDVVDNKLAASEFIPITDPPRKKFTPKDPRHKENNEDANEEKSENSVFSHPSNGNSLQQKSNSTLDNELIPKPKNRYRGNLRRDPLRRPSSTEPTVLDNNEVPVSKPNTTTARRPGLSKLRKRVQNKTTTEDTVESQATESSIRIENISVVLDIENSTSTEKSTSETAIMKIAKDERKNPMNEASVEDFSAIDPSQRVSDLTLAASKDYNNPGLFKSVSPNSRRVVPNYFTIATDDPILPIEAFFPQLNQKKES